MMGDRRVLFGVSVLSLCILLTEVVLTRIYSVTLGYHFAFLSISIALFGLGVSGILVYVRREWFPPERMHYQLSRAGLLCGVSLYIAVTVLLNLPLSPDSFITLGLIYLVSALPFFFGGLCLALIYTHRYQAIGRLYCFDLLGAAAGCLSVILVLNTLGGPSAIFLVGLMAVLTGVLFGWEHESEGEESARHLRNLSRAGMVVGLLCLMGFVASRYIQPVALGLGRRMFDRVVQQYPLPNTFEWYVRNYIGGQLRTITLFVKSLSISGLVLSLAVLGVAKWVRVRAQRNQATGLFRRAHLLLPAWAASLMICFLGIQLSTDAVRVRFAQGTFQPAPLFEKWNSISRIMVFPHKGWSRAKVFAWGLSPTYPGPEIEELRMNIDSTAAMPIIRFDGDLSSWQAQHLKYDVSSMGFYLTDHPESLIIGPGGGRDILTSLVFSARKVVGVELNPIILDVINNVFGDFTGRLYRRPDVNLTLGEGRAYLKRSSEHFDIIQVSLIDTWAALSRGALAISENTLYTQEAFDDYFAHLTDRGVLAFTRWWSDPPLLLWRMLGMTARSLERIGQDPAMNVAVIRGPVRKDYMEQTRVVNMLAKRTPMTPEDVRRIEEKCREMQFDLLYAPGRPVDPTLAALLQGGPGGRSKFLDSLRSDISPATDDRPFYFLTTRPRDFFLLDDTQIASGMLGKLLYLILFLVLAFMYAPLLLKRKDLESISAGGKKWLVYFVCLGVGFIVVEMVLVQRFILFLGHPIHATTVVLFAMLASSGLGSLFASRFAPETVASRLPLVLLGVVLLQGTTLVALPTVSSLFFHTSLGARIIVASMVIMPTGFLMGMPFAMGIRLLSQSSAAVVPWMWGVNGAASVFGTVVAACFSMNFGLTTSYVIGTSFYVVAVAMALPAARSARHESAIQAAR